MNNDFGIRRAELPVGSQIDAVLAGPYESLLRECLRLTRNSYLAPAGPFEYPWLDIGTGYFGFPCFGHWDIVHECYNLLLFAPQVIREQMEMYLSFIGPDGGMPGTVWGPNERNQGAPMDPKEYFHRDGFNWSRNYSHPPLWPMLLDDYFEKTNDRELLMFGLDRGLANLAWWKQNRRSLEGGFYYLDILTRLWESGVDDGVRFIDTPREPRTCIDATCHLAAMMKYLQKWAALLGRDSVRLERDIEQCEALLNKSMWDETTGFFYDIWMTNGSQRKIKSFEGFFPLMTGLADRNQVRRLVDHLINPNEFFTYHPIATVGVDEPEFELDCWRGPAWNSMTFWIVRALMQYGFKEEARKIGHQALRRSQEAFNIYGCIFEFYNSVGSDQAILWRKQKPVGACRDYLGHAPLIAMYSLIRE